jgi:hypothetical protein
MPNNPRAGGVSRRIEGEDRDQLRDAMDQLNIPDGMGAIIRTAGVGRSVEELQWDLDNLKTQWDAIAEGIKSRPAPFLVYQESDAVTRTLRDYLSEDIGEIQVDDPAAYAKAQEYMQRFMPPGADGMPVTWRSLLALGISGGIIPCPSALVVLLGAISLNKIGLGLVLVLAFSFGLAGALTAIGMAFIYAGRVFNRFQVQGRVVQLLPVLSALIVSGIGIGILIKAMIEIGWL